MADQIAPKVVPDFTEREGIRHLYAVARAQVAKAWGPDIGQLVGPALHRALAAEELMRLIAAQDKAVSAEVLRRLVDGTWEHLNADPDFQSGT
jgi:hypothetical protein